MTEEWPKNGGRTAGLQDVAGGNVVACQCKCWLRCFRLGSRRVAVWHVNCVYCL